MARAQKDRGRYEESLESIRTAIAHPMAQGAWRPYLLFGTPSCRMTTSRNRLGIWPFTGSPRSASTISGAVNPRNQEADLLFGGI